MSEIVNAQDKSGDTALNIAARIGNRSIISQLLEVGADASIPNRAGLRPVDFGIGGPAELADRQNVTSDKAQGKSTRENSGDIISCKCHNHHAVLILTSAAITSLLNETEKEFSTEIQAKQSIIDSIHAELRDASAQLGEEQRRLERLQARQKARDERKQKIANMQKAAQDEQFRLSQIQQQHGHMANGENQMRLGDADKAFTPLPHNIPAGAALQDTRLAASLPSVPILQARLNAYVANNEALEAEVRSLKGKSRDLEAKYRRIISLCTYVDEDKIDGVLNNLFRAVNSEHGDVELGRVREFLQKVESVE
jgi:DNA repair exonuclease SbcCD ATPase subunit